MCNSFFLIIILIQQQQFQNNKQSFGYWLLFLSGWFGCFSNKNNLPFNCSASFSKRKNLHHFNVTLNEWLMFLFMLFRFTETFFFSKWIARNQLYNCSSGEFRCHYYLIYKSIILSEHRTHESEWEFDSELNKSNLWEIFCSKN